MIRTFLCRMLYRAIERVTESACFPQPVKRWIILYLRQTAYLLEFEPSWFSEFGLGIGAGLWGAFCFLTDDFEVRGWAILLPCFAILLGTVRISILLRLWYGARVVLTSCSALLIGWVWWGLAGRYGVIPAMGWLAGAFAIELLTAAKFSLPCARELRDEYLEWRSAR